MHDTYPLRLASSPSVDGRQRACVSRSRKAASFEDASSRYLVTF
jgi:hypothetical protein